MSLVGPIMSVPGKGNNDADDGGGNSDQHSHNNDCDDGGGLAYRSL